MAARVKRKVSARNAARKSAVSSKNGVSPYSAAGVAIIVVLVVAGLWYYGTYNNAQTNVYSTTTVLLGAGGSVISSTSTPTCPCLSKEQIQGILNDSALQRSASVYNTTYDSNLTQTRKWVPPNFTGSIGDGWGVVYGIPNSTEIAEEIIVQTNDPAGLYNLSTTLVSKEYGKAFTYGGQVNGFTYSYVMLTSNSTPATLYLLYGYSGGYTLSFSMITTNRGVLPFSSIAAEIAPTV